MGQITAAATEELLRSLCWLLMSQEVMAPTPFRIHDFHWAVVLGKNNLCLCL